MNNGVTVIENEVAPLEIFVQKYRSLLVNDGRLGYVQIIGGAYPLWEQGHFHEGVHEMFTVVEGWMAIVYQEAKKDLVVCTLQAGEPPFSLAPQIPHSIWVPERTIIQVRALGKAVKNARYHGLDWYPASQEFNEVLESLVLPHTPWSKLLTAMSAAQRSKEIVLLRYNV